MDTEQKAMVTLKSSAQEMTMDDIEKRLAACFSSVLSGLSPEEIRQATAASVQSWDSVATVSLIIVVEEEFGISMDVDDPAKFDSFANILTYLREAAQQRKIASNAASE